MSGPDPVLKFFNNFQILQICKSIQMPSLCPKFLKLCKVIDFSKRNNFTFWSNVKIVLGFEL
jgi:hypothetical protein